MSDNSQREKKENNPGRINLMLEVLKGDAKKKVELPLRLLVMGDFTARDDHTPLGQRETININKDNVDGVMKSLGIAAEFTVADKLRGGDEEMKVALKVESMRDFHPEQVARQIPQVSRLVAARNLLQDLRNRVISASDFRKALERVIKDKASLEQFVAELERAVPTAGAPVAAASVEAPTK